MGYTIRYVDKEGECAIVPLFSEGVNVEVDTEICVEGSIYSQVDVTHNYTRIYRQYLGMSLLELLHGERGIDIAGVLSAGVNLLGTDKDKDCWKPTMGNAGSILNLLLSWVGQYPFHRFYIY